MCMCVCLRMRVCVYIDYFGKNCVNGKMVGMRFGSWEIGWGGGCEKIIFYCIFFILNLG